MWRAGRWAARYSLLNDVRVISLQQHWVQEAHLAGRDFAVMGRNGQSGQGTERWWEQGPGTGGELTLALASSKAGRG